jgi:maltose alpha-D-glucosyltransferase/alpha-amylase
MCFLETDDPSVLAHACTWRGQTVVATHNFSRAMRSVRIEWPKGTEKLELLFGQNIREPLSDTPAVLDLDPYDYHWLRLHRRNAAT